MSVRVRLTGTRLDAVPLTTEDLMRKIGQSAIVRIRQRTTNQNVDQHGAAFHPYSEGYAKLKATTGNTKVNLTASGDMLNALTITRVSKNSVTLGWSR